jgi:hypothetical protein
MRVDIKLGLGVVVDDQTVGLPSVIVDENILHDRVKPSLHVGAFTKLTTIIKRLGNRFLRQIGCIL